MAGQETACHLPASKAIPPSGVYAVKIRLGNKIYKGILNIGIRPTFNRGSLEDVEPTIEVHIFDFKRYAYGKDLEIMFVKKIVLR